MLAMGQAGLVDEAVTQVLHPCLRRQSISFFDLDIYIRIHIYSYLTFTEETSTKELSFGTANVFLDKWLPPPLLLTHPRIASEALDWKPEGRFFLKLGVRDGMIQAQLSSAARSVLRPTRLFVPELSNLVISVSGQFWQYLVEYRTRDDALGISQGYANTQGPVGLLLKAFGFRLSLNDFNDHVRKMIDGRHGHGCSIKEINEFVNMTQAVDVSLADWSETGMVTGYLLHSRILKIDERGR